MTELYLDNYQVFLAESTSIKIKSENVYFTKSGKYSLDVEVPLIGNHNNAVVFKHINRKEVKKTLRTFKARLIAGNKVVLDGIATITNITDISVKIQLLSGNAELNFQSKNDNLYIDELDLGKLEYEVKLANKDDSTGLLRDIANIDNQTERYKKMFGLYGETDIVYYPIFNETRETKYNDYCLRKTGKDTETIFFPHVLYSSSQPLDKISLTSFSSKCQCSPQPYFCYIIKKVFSALGYTVTENHIENTDLKNVFICNSKPTLYLNEMLPHWTINEFQTQIEYFFGVILVIDDISKTVKILSRNHFFASEETFISQVNDEYSVTCEENDTTDISNGNVGYSFEQVDPYAKIDAEILKNAEKKEFDTYEELASYYNGLNDTEKSKYIFSYGGKQYIHYAESETNKYLKEVNFFRDLVRNTESDNTDIELKIVPVRLETDRIKREGVKWDDFFKHYYATEGDNLDAVCMITSDNQDVFDSEFNIQEAIEGNSVNQSTKNIIEVAMNDGKLQKVVTDDGKTYYDFPWPFVTALDPLHGEKYRGFSFELNNVLGRNTMYNVVFGTVMKINTQSEIIFKFISNKMHDVMQLFIINNKSYVCKMIEYSVDPEGMKDEKTGYFYEYHKE